MNLSTYGISLLTLTLATGVHIDTARRWKHAGNMPAHQAALVALRTEGELGLINPSWRGWRIRDNTLWTPEDVAIRPGDIRAIPYRKEQLRDLQQRLAEPQQWTLL